MAVLGMLRGADEVEFVFVRDRLGISDSSLSQHLTVLDEAGMVDIRKRAVGRRSRTWLALSPRGKQELERYVDHIRLLAGEPATGSG